MDDLKVIELALEDDEVETLDTSKEGTVDIAFINADTGELEIVRIPEEQFSEQALQEAVQKAGVEQEGLVVLEVDIATKEPEEDDPNMRITHYPPSDRIH